MRDEDREAFGRLWRGAWALHGKTVTAEMLSIAWAALVDLEIREVERALTAHIRDPERGQYPPKPADVIARIRPMQSDGHLSADEAWALMPRSESETVVWTEEMAQAYAVASDLLAEGDAVGARMAFRACYERLVAEARAKGKPASWRVSLGYDSAQREDAIRQAVERGYLTAERAAKFLPPPAPDEKAAVALLEDFRARVRSLVRLPSGDQIAPRRARVAEREAYEARIRAARQKAREALEGKR